MTEFSSYERHCKGNANVLSTTGEVGGNKSHSQSKEKMTVLPIAVEHCEHGTFVCAQGQTNIPRKEVQGGPMQSSGLRKP